MKRRVSKRLESESDSAKPIWKVKAKNGDFSKDNILVFYQEEPKPPVPAKETPLNITAPISTALGVYHLSGTEEKPKASAKKIKMKVEEDSSSAALALITP